MQGGLRETVQKWTMSQVYRRSSISLDIELTQIFPGTRGIGNCPEKYGHYDEGPAVRHESP